LLADDPLGCGKCIKCRSIFCPGGGVTGHWSRQNPKSLSLGILHQRPGGARAAANPARLPKMSRRRACPPVSRRVVRLPDVWAMPFIKPCSRTSATKESASSWPALPMSGESFSDLHQANQSPMAKEAYQPICMDQTQ
jgi:hypothetical protein